MAAKSSHQPWGTHCIETRRLLQTDPACGARRQMPAPVRHLTGLWKGVGEGPGRRLAPIVTTILKHSKADQDRQGPNRKCLEGTPCKRTSQPAHKDSGVVEGSICSSRLVGEESRNYPDLGTAHAKISRRRTAMTPASCRWPRLQCSKK